MTPLELAKDKLRIPDVWHRIGLPGEPGKSCRSPFREDRNASFSIFDDGRRFKDFATGDRGDAVNFLAMAKNLSPREAARKLITLAGTNPPKRKWRKPRGQWPAFREGTPVELNRLTALRSVHREGLDIATRAGVLRFAAMADKGEAVTVWIVTDSTGRNAQARRLDGQPWHCLNGAKAKTLPGARAAWPIGAADIAERPFVALVEGGPDFLAAFHFLYAEGRENDVAPVCITGAGMILPPDATEHFRGKRIRIFGHADEQGQAAAERWAIQLHRAGAAKVDGFSFEGLIQTGGAPVQDLNDLTNQDADNWESTWDARGIFPWDV